MKGIPLLNNGYSELSLIEHDTLNLIYSVMTCEE